MAAGERNLETCRGVMRIHRLEHNVGVESSAGFGLERRMMDGSSARGKQRALLRDGPEARRTPAEPLHSAHRAVMLAGPAAAGGKVAFRVQRKQRRYQQPAD